MAGFFFHAKIASFIPPVSPRCEAAFYRVSLKYYTALFQTPTSLARLVSMNAPIKEIAIRVGRCLINRQSLAFSCVDVGATAISLCMGGSDISYNPVIIFSFPGAYCAIVASAGMERRLFCAYLRNFLILDSFFTTSMIKR